MAEINITPEYMDKVAKRLETMANRLQAYAKKHGCYLMADTSCDTLVVIPRGIEYHSFPERIMRKLDGRDVFSRNVCDLTVCSMESCGMYSMPEDMPAVERIFKNFGQGVPAEK